MHRISAGLVALPCVALLASCARPAPLLSYSSYTAPVAPDAAASPRDGRVTLREILAYADEHAPAIAAARSGSARAHAEQVAASPLVPSEPRVSVSVGARRAPGGSTVEAELAIEQEIEIAGQRGLRLDAAEATR